MSTGAIVTVSAFAAAVLLASLAALTGQQTTIFWFLPSLVLSIGVSTVISLRWKEHPFAPGVFAALLCFLLVMTQSVAGGLMGGVEDKASDPDCDAFCTTRTVGWIILVVVSAIWGTVLSFVAFLLAGTIAANRRKSAAAE